ncbi:MAG: penicillin-binding protein 2 [Verrucomicrobiia bacterium]
MTTSRQNVRVLVVIGAVGLAFVGLAFRLFQLHVFEHKDLLMQAIANSEQVLHRQGRRGRIVDVNGDLLANSLSARVVFADPGVTCSQVVATAHALAPLLQMNEETLAAKLSSPVRYVRLKQKVSEDTIQKIRALKLKGIGFEDQFMRSYPNGDLASHVLGFVDAEHKGVQGIESSMETFLQGHAGYEVIEHDRKGHEIRASRIEDLAPCDGFTVVLTIDQVIQHIAEVELEKAMVTFKPQAAMIILTRPKTGEILAMSCRPTFDPNKAGDAAADARRNRCVSDLAEPGSTFKIVTISSALSEGLVRLEDRFNCENGAWQYCGRLLHDAHPYGVLSVEEILFHSSNIGAAKIAVERMGPARVYDAMLRFGFGRKTGIAIPGEVSGIVHPLAKWNKLSISRIPMGHEVSVTPIQMIMALNAVANGGRLMKPLVVKSVLDEHGTPLMQYTPQLVGQPISPEATVLMTTALRKVPSPIGTAPKAAVPHYDVAGKTGTAQKLENGQYVNKYYSSFIGYLPASDPEISIYVSLDEPVGGAYYGGSVAGPVFRAVAEKVTQYLGIPPQQLDSVDTKKVASL